MLGPRSASAQNPQRPQNPVPVPLPPPLPRGPSRIHAPQVPQALVPHQPIVTLPANPGPVLITPSATAMAEARRRGALNRQASYQIEIYKKYALAVACIVFALLGAPIAIRFPRGGIGLVIGTSIAVFAIYYIGLIGGEELGDHGTVSPFFAMWTANLLFTVVGLIGLAVTRRPSRSPGGGDWAEVRASLFGWTRRIRL